MLHRDETRPTYVSRHPTVNSGPTSRCVKGETPILHSEGKYWCLKFTRHIKMKNTQTHIMNTYFTLHIYMPFLMHVVIQKSSSKWKINLIKDIMVRNMLIFALLSIMTNPIYILLNSFHFKPPFLFFFFSFYSPHFPKSEKRRM